MARDVLGAVTLEGGSALPAALGQTTKAASVGVAEASDSLPVVAISPRTMTHTSVAQSTGSASALASNASRKYACFQNIDAAINIALNLAGGTATAITGIVLRPGQSYEMSAAMGNLTTSAITSIAASGTPTLLVTEGV